MTDLSRREALNNLAGLGTAALAGPAPLFAADAKPNLIREENARPGTRDWMLTTPRIEKASKYRCPWIEGYCSRTDAAGLLRAKGFLSVGHDEYWTIEMFRNVQAAIAKGVNVAFLSGNAVCGRVVFEDKVRAFERVGVFGPPGGTREFQNMSSLAHERPYGNELMGAHSTGPVTGGADWICTKPAHWIYEGTGMKEGEAIPGIIGWEYHGDPAPIAGLEIVATGATQSKLGKPNGGTYTATIYPGPRGNFVFTAATCWWADGLSAPPGYVRPKVYTEPKGPDARIQRITQNLLERMRRA